MQHYFLELIWYIDLCNAGSFKSELCNCHNVFVALLLPLRLVLPTHLNALILLLGRSHSAVNDSIAYYLLRRGQIEVNLYYATCFFQLLQKALNFSNCVRKQYE